MSQTMEKLQPDMPLGFLYGRRVVEMIDSGEMLEISHTDNDGRIRTFVSPIVLGSDSPMVPNTSLLNGTSPNKTAAPPSTPPSTTNTPPSLAPNKRQPEPTGEKAGTQLSPSALATIARINALQGKSSSPTNKTAASPSTPPSTPNTLPSLAPNLGNNANQSKPTKANKLQRMLGFISLKSRGISSKGDGYLISHVINRQNSLYDTQKFNKRIGLALGVLAVGCVVALALQGHDVSHGLPTQTFTVAPPLSHHAASGKGLLHATAKGIDTLHRPDTVSKTSNTKEHSSTLKHSLNLGRMALLKLSSQNQPGIIKGLNVHSSYPWTIASAVNRKDPINALNQAANVYNKMFKSNFSLKSYNGTDIFTNGNKIIDPKQQVAMNWIIEMLNKTKTLGKGV